MNLSRTLTVMAIFALSTVATQAAFAQTTPADTRQEHPKPPPPPPNPFDLFKKKKKKDSTKVNPKDTVGPATKDTTRKRRGFRFPKLPHPGEPRPTPPGGTI